jgi:hypothetical protein
MTMSPVSRRLLEANSAFASMLAMNVPEAEDFFDKQRVVSRRQHDV